MKEELLLILLSIRTIIYIIFNSGGVYNLVGINNTIELIKIYPHYQFLKIEFFL